jgi:hypothetical protein
MSYRKMILFCPDIRFLSSREAFFCLNPLLPKALEYGFKAPVGSVCIKGFRLSKVAILPFEALSRPPRIRYLRSSTVNKLLNMIAGPFNLHRRLSLKLNQLQ